MDLIKRVLRRCAKYKWLIIGGIGLALLMNVSRLIMPQLTGTIVDDVIKGETRNLDLLFKICAMILGLAFVRSASHYVRNICFEKASQGFVFDLRTELYDHMQEMPYEFYDKNRIGEIMSRMTGDIDGLRNFVAGGILTIIENTIWFFGSVGFLFALNAKLTFLLLAMAPLVAFFAYLFSKKVRPAHRLLREQNAVLNTRAQENISGVRVVKAFAREDYEQKRFDEDNMKTYDLQMNWVTLWATYFPLLDFVASMCTPLVIAFGGYMVVNGTMTLGDLVAFNGYIWMVNAPMRSLGNIVNMITNTQTSAEKLFYYLDLGPSIKNKEKAKKVDTIRGDVEFRNVNFSYGDEQVLTDINFSAPAGSTVALMGLTGSGKTSIVNLISRFYDVPEGCGEVLVDGVNVKDYDYKSLRRNVGYVAQETFLFSETAANNIAFGDPKASMDDIRRAARIAQADEFIDHMPDGYDTIVGERGMGLSGGQKQRVAIARAILYNPRILVMDDSTSAVDMETEFEIQKQLKAELGKRTTFIIAHRISSVKNADLILVMDKGRIVERGKHDELLKMNGVYAGMYYEQYKDFDKVGD
ncbi:MAG: ABC transporter ATP-binding protein [Clostridiales bacterium]|nr:ABC transporter ATP-binding protein [Clostridiales bacterium]